MPETTMQPNNIYGGNCINCHAWVAEMMGRRSRSATTGRWEVRHFRNRETGQCLIGYMGDDGERHYSHLLQSVLTDPGPQTPTLAQVGASRSFAVQIDLTRLPRPSRDRLNVLSVDGDTYFRIVRSRSGVIAAYAGRSYTYHPTRVATQVTGSSTASINNGAYTEMLRQICADPTAALQRYGRVVGRCGHCGRRLTDPVSVNRGIGPVCYGRTRSERWYTTAPSTTPRGLEGIPHLTIDQTADFLVSISSREDSLTAIRSIRTELDELGHGEIR